MPKQNYELLLPVGNFEMALAAIHNGADAIYVGFPGYNARGRSIDFEVEDLRQIINTCHLYGVKTHLALNIVIFQDELTKLVPLLERILPLKPDALIVQDLGLARLIREMAPDQVLHASTQMTVTNADAIALLEDLRIKRFVLGRENSLPEIAQIKKQSQKDLEVFVHGALCVAYSGQCFTSESIGGRSANRGQCAQSCRFSYEMYVDGEKRDLVDRKHVVSPQDLCGISDIPALMEAGVDSFKIEGRLKSPEYVAAAAREYRVAIDRHLEGHDLAPHELKSGMSRMGSVYSRGFFSGWLHGVDHQRLVDGTFSSNRGLRIGQIVDVRFDRMTVELDQPVELAPGDGLLWAYSRGEESFEEGAQIYSVRHLAKRMAAHKSTAPIAQQSSADETARTDLGQQTYELQFANTVTLRPDLIGAKLYLNHDSSLKKDLQKSFHDKNSFKRVPVDLSVEVALGTPLKVTMSDGANQCEALGSSLVQEAQNRAVSDDFIKDELGALGGSVFTLREFTIRRLTDRPIFYPHKELKEIRRALTAQLEELRSTNRIARYETAVAPSENIVSWLETQKRTSEPAKAGSEGGTASSTRLNVLLREKAQVFDMVEAWSQGRIDRESIDTVILDFEFGTDYEPSIRALKDAKIRCGIATTRILKPKEYTNLIRIERLQPDVVLVRNLGALHYFTSVSPFPGELRGDFSLNVTNHLTARYLLSKGLTSVTASYDMNSRQVTDFLVATDASRVEITAHQYMPSFHMEHCVFAAFLSKGSSFRDCGKPCEKHRVELKDQFGNRHQIKPDQECRNTMFNANSQSASRFVKAWQEQGLGFIRYEALYERGDELIEKVRGYQDLLSGKATPDDLIANLKLHEKYGLGEGPIGKTQEYQSRKKQ